MAVAAEVAVLGIRHHGPGSARSVRAALEQIRPTRVLIEGPPELDDVVAFAARPDMRPPVAGLVYAVDEPQRAVFYPFADFSPEWVALRWALQHEVPVGFADLPAGRHLALRSLPGVGDGHRPRALRRDPLAVLAQAAGYDDAERWWEDAVEQRSPAGDARARFEAVTAAMVAVRERDEQDHREPGEDEVLLAREAAMRRLLRAAARDRTARIAFVCGAYHAPVLVPGAWPAKALDDGRLRDLPSVKVAATWAPWTSQRLAVESGYGAGVTSPGWYQHLFGGGPDLVVRWMVAVSNCLRRQQHHASPAAAVDAARLAEALAALRGRPLAGLEEVTDAVRAVLCDGSDVPLRLIRDQLVVGRRLGRVPADTPQVPLARDLTAQQKRLRLRPDARQKIITVDLRDDGGRARSVLLHRLVLLGIPWGNQVDAGRTTGTFKEAWQLQWQPELAVELVVAGVHGTTVAAAAAAKVADDAEASSDLRQLAELAASCLVADLPDGLTRVLEVLARRTAQQHDAVLLMTAIEPLARTHRYGDVRGVDTTAIARVLDVLVIRAAIGLPTAVASLDDERAETARAAIEAAQRGIALLDAPVLRQRWHTALDRVANQPGVHGSVQGRVVRLLFDATVCAPSTARAHVGRNLSNGVEPRHGAAWLDGFLAGDALLLLYDPELLGVVDDWVAGVAEESFDDVLPLLRRAFARWQPAERRMVGEQLRRGRGAPVPDEADDADDAQAAPAVATVARLLGLTP